MSQVINPSSSFVQKSWVLTLFRSHENHLENHWKMMINRWILDDPYVAHPEVPAEARTVAMHIGQWQLDTCDLGMAHGPPLTTASFWPKRRARTLIFAPRLLAQPAWAIYPCSQDDSCSNSNDTAWLCNGAQPLGLVQKVWYNINGKTVDLRNAHVLWPVQSSRNGQLHF